MKVFYIVEVVSGQPFAVNNHIASHCGNYRFEFTNLTSALKAVNHLIKRGCHIQMFASNASGEKA